MECYAIWNQDLLIGMMTHGRHPRIGMTNRHNWQNGLAVFNLRVLDLMVKSSIGWIVFSVLALIRKKKER